MIKILNRIAEHRKAHGLTQQQLADLVGAHWITISKLERGKIKLTTQWAEKIAQALNLEAILIFGEPVEKEIATVYARTDEYGNIVENELTLPESDLSFEYSDFVGNASWCEIKTNLFQPIIYPGDMIRILTARGDIDPDLLLDRLVVVEFIEKHQPREMLAILSRGKDLGRFDLRSSSGILRSNVAVRRLGIVGAIVPQARHAEELFGSGQLVALSIDRREE